jgi:hypothetical protein
MDGAWALPVRTESEVPQPAKSKKIRGNKTTEKILMIMLSLNSY